MNIKLVKLFLVILIIIGLLPNYSLNSEENSRESKYSIESYTRTKWGSDYTVDVRLRTIDVTILDKDGKHVLGLKPEDFKIYENGEEQKISSFDFVNHLKHIEQKEKQEFETAAEAGEKDIQEKNLEPRYFALAVLDMTVYPKKNRQVIEAIEDFITTKIAGEDYVAIYQVSRTFTKCLMPFTKSHDLVLNKLKNEKEGLILTNSNISLTKKIDNTASQILLEFRDQGILPDDSRAPEYLEAINDRVINNDFTYVMNNIKVLGSSIKDYIGKKNIILFSVGLPYKNETTLKGFEGFPSKINKAIESLSNDFNAYNISIFIMDLAKWEVMKPADVMSAGEIRSDKDITRYSDDEVSRVAGFRTVSANTGGEFYHQTLSSPEKLERSFDDINYKTGVYYTIGYYPEKEPVPGKNVDIEIETTRKDADLSYRKSLFTPKKYSQLNSQEKEQYFINAVYSPGVYSQMFLTSDLRLFPSAGNKYITQYAFQMDKNEIIHKYGDKPVSKLDLVFLVFTENREILKNTHKILDIDFYDLYEKKGINKVRFYDYLVLPAGKYIVRYFIRDQFTGNIASDELKITIPDRTKEDTALSSLMVIGENRNLMVLSEHIPLPGRENIEIDPENPQYFEGEILSQTITEPIKTNEDCYLFFNVSSSLDTETLENSYKFSITSKSDNYTSFVKPKLIGEVKHLDGTTGFLYKLNNANLKPDDYVLKLSLVDPRGKISESVSIFKIL